MVVEKMVACGMICKDAESKIEKRKFQYCLAVKEFIKNPTRLQWEREPPIIKLIHIGMVSV